MKTPPYRKLKNYKLISVIILITGVALMVYMITVEDEPGAIPLLLILIGAGGYLFTRSRIRSQ